MALYNGRILMRRGLEADFDASKLMSGEWALSTDEGIIRICSEAGTVIRMATYEAFEEDMMQIEAILLECQSIEEAVTRINTEIDTKVDAVVDYVAQAKTYRDEALRFRNEAEQFAPEGYADLVEQVQENTVKVDTIIEKADLGIKETASGEEIHLTDSAEGKAVEFALYGKAKQNTTSGSQLLDVTNVLSSRNGVSISIEELGRKTTVKGTQVRPTVVYKLDAEKFVGKNITVKAKSISKSISNSILFIGFVIGTENGNVYHSLSTNLLSKTFDVPQTVTSLEFHINVNDTATALETENVVVIEELMVSENANAEWEPYTNGASPNPSYPQEIEVSGESYNLLYHDSEDKVIGNVTYTTNADKSITANGTSNTFASISINLTLKAGKYILSGCPSGGTENSSYSQLLRTVDENVIGYDTGNGLSFELTEETELILYTARIVTGYKANNLTFYPMIRKASVKNDRYMPFGVGSVEVKCKGKNLAKLELGTLAHDTTGEEVDSDIRLRTNFIPVTYNEKYIATNDGLVVKNGVIYDKNKNYLGYGVYPYTDSNIMHITHKDARYIRLIYGNASNSTINPNDYKYQLEIGQVASPYVPYKEPIISTIQTENGLAGIKVSSNGNYTDQNGQQWICDEVVKYADGSGKKVQRIGKFVLNGSETYSQSSYTDDNRLCVYTKNNMIANINSNPVICDKFTTGDYRTNTNANIITSVGSNINIAISKTIATTIEELKTYLSNNPTTVFAPLATQIETPLTAEELAEISTFYPVTNISNDFDCGMKVKYNCDSKNYIDNKIALLTTAMVNSI